MRISAVQKMNENTNILLDSVIWKSPLVENLSFSALWRLMISSDSTRSLSFLKMV